VNTQAYIILTIWITGIPFGFLAWRDLISWKEKLDIGDLFSLVVAFFPFINFIVYLEDKISFKNPFYKK